MRFLGNLLLKLIGWKIVGSFPNVNKFIVIVAPHTSNWDMVIGLIGRFSLGIKISFLAKKQIFRFPFVGILHAIGGVPVDRSKAGNLVANIAKLFAQSDKLYLAITPEGTRKPVTKWKEGFYHMAHQAQVPIVMVGFDYARKEIIIDAPFMPSDSIESDFAHILSFFRTIKGYYPKDIPDYHQK